MKNAFIHILLAALIPLYWISQMAVGRDLYAPPLWGSLHFLDEQSLAGSADASPVSGAKPQAYSGSEKPLYAPSPEQPPPPPAPKRWVRSPSSPSPSYADFRRPPPSYVPREERWRRDPYPSRGYPSDEGRAYIRHAVAFPEDYRSLRRVRGPYDQGYRDPWVAAPRVPYHEPPYGYGRDPRFVPWRPPYEDPRARFSSHGPWEADPYRREPHFDRRRDPWVRAPYVPQEVYPYRSYRRDRDPWVDAPRVAGYRDPWIRHATWAPWVEEPWDYYGEPWGYVPWRGGYGGPWGYAPWRWGGYGGPWGYAPWRWGYGGPWGYAPWRWGYGGPWGYAPWRWGYEGPWGYAPWRWGYEG
ncbi:MAG: hypothetical protein D6819_01795, partial [Gammaproteobacteria bacterium]